VERSDSGARLLVDDADCVPDTFTLVHKGPAVTLWKCRVVWRSGRHDGAEFDGDLAVSA
jgi:hypothetical protein